MLQMFFLIAAVWIIGFPLFLWYVRKKNYLTPLMQMLRDGESALFAGDYSTATTNYMAALEHLNDDTKLDTRESIQLGCLIGLGMALHQKGSYSEADECFEEARQFGADIVKSNDPAILRAYANLARHFLDADKTEDWVAAMDRVQTLTNEVTIAEQPDAVKILEELGQAFEEVDKHEQAENCRQLIGSLDMLSREA